jgi:hypothetical protein
MSKVIQSDHLQFFKDLAELCKKYKVYGQVLNDPPDVIGARRRCNGDQDWKHTWESEDGFIYREDDVTHWMPLPKLPEE